MTRDRVSPGRLAGKVAIVTGAASSGPGIGNGKATAILFAREGAKVVLVNRDLARAQLLQREIEGEGGDCMAVAADVTQADQVERLVDSAIARYGSIHILHNNAGAGGPGRVTAMDDHVWARALDVNVTGTMRCCRAVIPRIIAAGGGAVINVSSLAAVQGFRRGDTGFSAYAAAKSALHGLTLAMAADYAAEGVRVNCLVVGMVNTPLLAHLGEQARDRRRLSVPLKTEGTGWDVGWAAVFLASDEARWITGVSLPIDGGQLAVREWPD